MEAYGKVLLIAIPIFFTLVLIEAFYGWLKGNQTLRQMDTISSLSSGITNTMYEIMGLSIVLISYGWMVDYLAIFSIENTILVYTLSFIAIDFAGYCNHRLQHSINYFWNIHVIHHSSEEFNLPCALRQSISNIFGIGAIFLLPAALIGIPVEVVGVIAPLHLFLQFWYHTKHIPKLGFLEKIIVTPSQHRVHHAINDEYLDKNLGQIFPWWDHLFGTYQEELDEFPCVYGVKKPVRTWNPLKINFMHLWLLAQDAWHTEKYWDKLRIWFMPTGWRPDDMVSRRPIEIITDPYSYEKYEGPHQQAIRVWTWVQFLITNVLVIDFLLHFVDMGIQGIFLYGIFVFMLVYSYSALMDQDKNSIYYEILKSVYGIGLIAYMGQWFMIDQLSSIGTYLMTAYLVISVVVVGYFSFVTLRSEDQVSLN